jgi:hypothetical protein
MDKIFVNIIILPMLNYFKLLYEFFYLLKKFILHFYDYLWLFSITFGYFKLLLTILTYFTLGYFRLV